MKPRKLKAAKQITASATPRKSGAPSIVVDGVMSRTSHFAFQTSLYIPQDVRERVEARLDKGSLSTAMVGLLVFALDVLDASKSDLRIQCDVETVTSREE